MKIKKVASSGKWVPLKFDDDISNINLEGLIGIEELKDYSIINDKGKRDRKNVKNKKSKLSDDDETDSPPPKKKKTEKNKKSKVKSSKEKKIEETNEVEEEVEEKKEGESKKEDSKEPESTFNKDVWTSLGVPEEVIKSLSDQNFHTPTLIQSLTLVPAILGRRDILGAAETGSGKTLAFGIPIINGILEIKKKLAEKEQEECENEISSEEEEEEEESSEEEILSGDENKIGCVKVVKLPDDQKSGTLKRKPLYALILTPTRELAIQVKNHLKAAAKYTDIQIAVVVGGMAAVKQERILKKGPEIVIATPGRLWELISEKNSHLSQINSIKFLAIDETDRMLEKGHFEELHSIIELMNSDKKKVAQRQNFVFSATLSLVHETPDYIKRKRKNPINKAKLTPEKKLNSVIEMLEMKNPKIVDITKQKGTAGGLTECRITCTIDHKDYYLYYFLKRHPGRTLVFCNSIGCVKRLATLFGILECKPLPLHANMIQRQRLKNLERFQEDSNGVLISTDVAARGLDIPNVDHVIHYQVPRTSESYVHRSGRTARAQKEGITVMIMEPSEFQFYVRLCKTLGRSHDIPTFPIVDNLLVSIKEQVDTAREIDKMELICKRDNVQKDWVRKAIEDMDIIVDDNDSTMNTKESADLRKQLKMKKHQLRALLMKPLFPRGFSGKYPETNIETSLEKNSEKAIDVMKKALDSIPIKRKQEKKTIAVIKRNKKALKQKMKSDRRNIRKKDKKSKRNQSSDD